MLECISNKQGQNLDLIIIITLCPTDTICHLLGYKFFLFSKLVTHSVHCTKTEIARHFIFMHLILISLCSGRNRSQSKSSCEYCGVWARINGVKNVPDLKMLVLTAFWRPWTLQAGILNSGISSSIRNVKNQSK